jgi:hypothetical protein
MREDVPKQDSFCLFYDPQGLNHIFIQNIHNHTTKLPLRTPQSFTKTSWNEMSAEDEVRVKYAANSFLVKYLS